MCRDVRSVMELQKPLILIVDDQPANIQMLAEALGRDYRIKIATNGQTALKIARMQEKPDLILLDVIMPGLDGYEVCLRLKQDEPTKRIPLIFVTAKSDICDEEYGFNIGAVDYITKPFALPVVHARIRTQILLKRRTNLLESIAFLDGLTGIHNRRYFDQKMENEWKRARRNQAPVSLILADVDYFKQYNDHYGHGVGDECLRRIAGVIASSVCRAGDLAARVGGEEFAVLLPETENIGAHQVAERIRGKVEEMEIPHKHSKACDRITLSLGYCSLIPTGDTSPGLLMDTADKMLYQAKNEGRNMVRGPHCAISYRGG